ncbi:acyclic terpene utilization AtuA family protein [Ramlibacter albus]|uniref:DUF1446 domain-containing protein n=1 Tax=Ramlibacter albus TaxID=2079448 RepID=A0A923MA13_9BURK|nr:acyclic terpene utilization AtuA family protein [Ramlibacter albus]MBC5767052.1 DUF1446 domain-containing protein [Ramlibacter albus]
MTSPRTIKIGGACGFTGDSPHATPQLLQVPGLDYLIYDYLAEMSMGIFARSRSKGVGREGWSTDFIEQMMKPNLRTLAEKGVKVVANAGGVDPVGCANSLRALIAEQGLSLKVAAVHGDDLVGRIDEFRAPEMFSGRAMPQRITGANAYLGAAPIVRALAMGADIVVTGRVADSALALGPLVHEFGWAMDDFERMAQGTVAGHLIECGAQVTGGTYTDWFESGDWSRIGYPVAEVDADGRIVITKPAGTGGVVNTGTVSEQLMYEVDDPANYHVADVIVDFTGVTVHQLGPDRVEVRGVQGRRPTDTYKVCATYQGAYRCMVLAPVIGVDAPAKAERQARALIDRNERAIVEAGHAPFSLRSVELLGTEASYGANARALPTREVVAKIVVDHKDRKALEVFRADALSPITSMSPGSTGWHFGRPSIYAVMHVFSLLAPKSRIPALVELDGHTETITGWIGGGTGEPARARIEGTVPAPDASGPMRRVRLIDIAIARSGDKGDRFMAAIIARKPAYLPWIRAALTPERLGQHMGHVFDGAEGTVTRYDVPGLNAINLLFDGALAGGQLASPRLDALAKGMGQQLLELELDVPESLDVVPYEQRAAGRP